MSNAKFKVGDRVKKPLGYEFPGEVRAVFTTMADAPRVVVEMTDAQGKGRGLLHIFAESQIALADTPCANWPNEWTYASKQATKCAGCGQWRHTPLRNDEMGGYVCLGCIDRELERLQRETSTRNPMAES